MGISRCRVSYLDQEGLDHSVEVEAESLYEAVAIAVAEFRQGEIITDILPGEGQHELILLPPVAHESHRLLATPINLLLQDRSGLQHSHA